MNSLHSASRVLHGLKKSSFIRWTLFSLGSFVGVFLLTIFFAEFLHFPEDWAFLPPVLILFFWNFITMRYFVYGRPVVPIVEQFIKYAGSAIGFRTIEFFVYWILVSKMGVRYTTAVAVVMPVGFTLKFLFYKTHVFTSQPYDQAQQPSLTASDIETLVNLHCESLPDSMITRMGPAYVKAFYRYVIHSDSEILRVKRHEEKICTACVISLQPKNLSRRLLFETPLAVSVIMRLPHLLKRQYQSARGNIPSHSLPYKAEVADVEPLPELLLIYSSPQTRGKGFGAEIMIECEAEMRKRGIQKYSLKTVEDDSNKATRFYQRLGLEKRFSIRKHGRLFSVFTKELSESLSPQSDQDLPRSI